MKARLTLPGHLGHGKLVEIVEVCPAFNVAPPDAAPCYREVVFVRWPGQDEPVGVGRDHLSALTFDPSADAVDSYYDAIHAIGEDVKAGKRPVPTDGYFGSAKERHER